MEAASIDDRQVGTLLLDWRAGDAHAQNTLFSMLHNELLKLSHYYLSKESAVSLQANDLVNEAALRLLSVNQISWQDKAHFLALAATTMRRILVDHVRRKKANKRDHLPVTLITEFTDERSEVFDTLCIHEALTRLHDIDEQRARIVELRFFGGLSIDEIAYVCNLSASTVKRSWRASRAWLLTELTTI